MLFFLKTLIFILTNSIFRAIMKKKGVVIMKEQLRFLRKSKGLTQEEAAEIFGVKPTTYQKYERDVISPSYETLGKIADFYDVTTDYLLGREKMKEKNDADDLIREIEELPSCKREVILSVLHMLRTIENPLEKET